VIVVGSCHSGVTNPAEFSTIRHHPAHDDRLKS